MKQKEINIEQKEINMEQKEINMEQNDGTDNTKINYGVELNGVGPKCNTYTPLKNTEDIMDNFFNSEPKKIKRSDLSQKDNILITGIGGFVGSHLANVMKTREKNVIGILRDLIPSDWLSNALSGCTIVNGDIRNKELIRRVVEHYDINQIYHVAAAANVKQAHNNPADVFDTNVMGTVSLLEAARLSGRFNFDDPKMGNIIILNTDKVYGEKMNAIENDEYHPSEPYATSKCCQGFVAQTYRSTYDMNVKITHSCNIFGFDPFNDRLIPNVIKKLIKGESPIIYNNDSSIREYIFINDLVDALYLLMSDTYDKSSYNIRTGWIYNQKDIIEKIVEYWNDINFENITPIYEKGNIPRQIQNESMQSVSWDWNPSWNFSDAIRETTDLFMIYKFDFM